MAVEMSRGEMRTMVAGMLLAHAMVAGEDPDSQLAKALDSITKRLMSTGQLTREEKEKIRDICDGFINRHEDRATKRIRDEIAVEMEDAQIKKTHHPSLNPVPQTMRPTVPRVPTPTRRSSFSAPPRGDWSKAYDDFYATVETSLYVPAPSKNDSVAERIEAFLKWANTQPEFKKFFHENRTLVLTKGVRLWATRYKQDYIPLGVIRAEIDRFYDKYLPHVDRKAAEPKKKGKRT